MLMKQRIGGMYRVLRLLHNGQLFVLTGDRRLFTLLGQPIR